jgi:hypothetical protein
MNVESTLEADTKLAEAGEQGMCALDDPSMTSLKLFALNTFSGDSCRDAEFLQVA